MIWFNLKKEIVRLGLLIIGVCSLASPVLANHAVILIYHHVDTSTPLSTSIDPDLFGQHLDYLANNGFQVLPLPQVVKSLREGHALPDRTVVFTFDDGYESVYENAFPLLKARNWPFTIFLCPAAIDAGQGNVVTWDQLREMATSGASIANHSNSHDHLVLLKAGESEAQWRSRVKADLLAAESRLAQEFGAGTALLAYPYGEHDLRLQDLLLELDWTAFGQQSGPAWSKSDFTALPRFPMTNGFGRLDDFAVKVNSMPLPVLEAEQVGDLHNQGEHGPVLRLKLGNGPFGLDGLAAYTGGQGRINLLWHNKDARVCDIYAPKPLPPGRSRYNVTVPSLTGDRYYWFSYSWIIR